MFLWTWVPNYWVLFVVAFITYAAVNFYQGPHYTLVMEVVDPDQIGYANMLARTTAQIGSTAISFVSAEFPSLEIESCASGGARADLGILRYTSRLWTSDTNDPLERQTIQRGFSYFFPPEQWDDEFWKRTWPGWRNRQLTSSGWLNLTASAT
jgi:hypothetical protein